MFLTHVKNDAGYKYRSVVGMTDPEKVITVISKNGYATDPAYITKIMKLIKQYNLTKYDQ
jgi:flagellum-specific peptidoglycan hydrolase FlgJ